VYIETRTGKEAFNFHLYYKKFLMLLTSLKKCSRKTFLSK